VIGARKCRINFDRFDGATWTKNLLGVPTAQAFSDIKPIKPIKMIKSGSRTKGAKSKIEAKND
jgi:ribosomal protein L10